MAQVREATIDDAPAVEEVWERVAAEGEWIGTELPLRPGWQDRFRQAVASPNVAWFVVGVGGNVVGGIFVDDQGGLAHIGMAIIDGHRGRGLGAQLLDTAISWARDKGCHKVMLEVWPHNARARALYERAGFVEEGYLRRQYRRASGALWDAVAMGLVLDDIAPARP